MTANNTRLYLKFKPPTLTPYISHFSYILEIYQKNGILISMKNLPNTVFQAIKQSSKNTSTSLRPARTYLSNRRLRIAVFHNTQCDTTPRHTHATTTQQCGYRCHSDVNISLRHSLYWRRVYIHAVTRP